MNNKVKILIEKRELITLEKYKIVNEKEQFIFFCKYHYDISNHNSYIDTYNNLIKKYKNILNKL